MNISKEQEIEILKERNDKLRKEVIRLQKILNTNNRTKQEQQLKDDWNGIFG